MDVYVWVSVFSWMGGQGGDLISGIFEAAPECPEDLCFYFSAKTTQRAVPTKTCETGREG